MAKGKYKQLVDSFAGRIHSGKLSAGSRLPTHRELSTSKGIALATASRVYAELEEMGLVSGETGRGTFVKETNLPRRHSADLPPPSIGMIDLSSSSPSLPGQTEQLRKALRDLASSSDLEALLRYQPHAGRANERAIVARHLECRDLHVEPDQVYIVSGAQHGLSVAVMSLLKPGDVVAVDALTYAGFKNLAEVYRLELVPIPSLTQGPDLDAFEDLCQKRAVKAIYAMPTLHNPLGWVLSLKQRERLVSIARKHEIIIVEDAVYAYLAKDPPPPLAALAPELTVYISGLSKNVATGLRVGYLVTPLHWAAKIDRSIRVTTWNTPALITGITCNWIEDGTVLRLENEKRKDATIRQSIAREAFQGLEIIGHPSSYFLWLPLGEDVRADQIAMDLVKSNISATIAEPFATTIHVPHALRLALGSVEFKLLRTVLNKVRSIINDHSF